MKKILFTLNLFVSASPVWALANRPSDPSAPPPPGWVQIVPFVFMIGVFYFLLFRPQSKQKQEKQKMLTSLKKGDRIVTQGGLIATVVNVSGQFVEAKISEDTKVKFLASAVTEIFNEQQSNTPAVTNS